MNTRKYDSQTRKTMKRAQRTPEYVALQQRTAKERADLEAKLAQREAPLKKRIALLESRARDLVSTIEKAEIKGAMVTDYVREYEALVEALNAPA